MSFRFCEEAALAFALTCSNLWNSSYLIYLEPKLIRHSGGSRLAGMTSTRKQSTCPIFSPTRVDRLAAADGEE